MHRQLASVKREDDIKRRLKKRTSKQKRKWMKKSTITLSNAYPNQPKSPIRGNPCDSSRSQRAPHEISGFKRVSNSRAIQLTSSGRVGSSELFQIEINNEGVSISRLSDSRRLTA